MQGNFLLYIAIFALTACSELKNKKDDMDNKISHHTNQKITAKTIEIDSFFLAWNKATYESILINSKTTSNLFEREKYKEALTTFKSVLGIRDVREINKNSIRYKFIQLILQQLKFIDTDYSLIEIKTEGEVVEFKNYIVLSTTNIVDTIWSYVYESPKWVVAKDKEDAKKCVFQYSRKIFGDGNNSYDVIITKFSKNSNVLSSDYFIYSTLQIPNCIIR